MSTSPSATQTSGAAASSADAAPVQLDRQSFASVLRVVALRVPAQKCTMLQKLLEGHVLHKPKVRPIIVDPEAELSEKSAPRTRLLLSFFTQHLPFITRIVVHTAHQSRAASTTLHAFFLDIFSPLLLCSTPHAIQWNTPALHSSYLLPHRVSLSHPLVNRSAAASTSHPVLPSALRACASL